MRSILVILFVIREICRLENITKLRKDPILNEKRNNICVNNRIISGCLITHKQFNINLIHNKQKEGHDILIIITRPFTNYASAKAASNVRDSRAWDEQSQCMSSKA